MQAQKSERAAEKPPLVFGKFEGAGENSPIISVDFALIRRASV
jgi:hypothetical protein